MRCIHPAAAAIHLENQLAVFPEQETVQVLAFSRLVIGNQRLDCFLRARVVQRARLQSVAKIFGRRAEICFGEIGKSLLFLIALSRRIQSRGQTG